MSFKDVKDDKKFKIGIAIFIVILVLALVVGGYILCKNISKPDSNSFESNIEQTIPPEQAKNNNEDKNEKEDNTIKDKEQNKEKSDNDKKENQYNPNESDALSKTSEDATPVQALFYSSFGNKITYPVILNDPEKNIIKIYTVYTLENLKDMQELRDQVLSDKKDKMKYLNALETIKDTFNGLLANSQKIEELCKDGDNSEQAQEITTLISQIKGEAEVDYNTIRTSSSFGVPMIKTFPFGMNLDDNVNRLNNLSNTLGCDDEEALNKWIAFSKKNLDMYLK
ncbi:hypothetical protein [Clostridium perfringens]|uniref:Uncharacterized protein n=2 Tax=Clostridium perfringens E str. JGS1987 TaxID=451755 RepID=B1BQW9_CLOPF|nr:hypothetical protein [Clostridium perfringens]EDT15879.1 hypothetical protein AC3_A0096 [Clostridium perfringens E str. JGS1987]MCX0408710.1 hypothetical protein [Clostridium perfringens]MDU3019883.1 hypothetical protein [Clostridium perfringens]UBK51283.1 hypothetical protein KLF52_15270 [Clostridium perfringens]